MLFSIFNIAKKKAVKDAKKQRKLERRKARAEEQGEGQGKDGAMSDDGSSLDEDPSSLIAPSFP